MAQEAAISGPRMPGEHERGYTLVELLVVMGIIGVLLAIAIPVFMGAQHRAEDRKAQADLRTALAAGLTYFSEAGAWDAFDAAEAELAEPSLLWLDGGAPTGQEISIQVHAGWDLLIVRRSTSGRFFCLAQILANPSTTRGAGAAFTAVDSVAECVGGW